MSNTYGGKRQNSGAKQKYGEPTKTATFRSLLLLKIIDRR